MTKKLFAILLALILSVTCLVSPAMASQANAQPSESPDMAFIPAEYQGKDDQITTQSTEKDDTQIKILVSVGDGETVFLQTGDLDLAVASADNQQMELRAAESAMESALGEAVEVEHYFSLVFNGFSFTGERWMVDAINQVEGLSAMESPVFELVEPEEEDTNIDLTPSMDISTGMTGAVNAWDLGYTGEGMVVAIIDTGIKQTHEAFSVAPEGAKIDEAYLDELFEKYGDLMHCKNTDGVYYSAKMPYNWDYFDGDHIPNHTQSNHGSHVAGIVAGNNGDDFKGIAPDAQIISLQIFNKAGGATVDLMLASMEDCAYLGVDAVNMSLGIANGFETYEWPANFGPVYEALEKAGVAVCLAAGNDAHAYISTAYGNWNQSMWQWLSSNPDHGKIGCPGTYVGSFTVGNTVNVNKKSGDVFKLNGKEYIPAKSASSGVPDYAGIAAGSYDVVDCGIGTPEQYAAAGNLTGKIVLVERGGQYNGATMSFNLKCQYAAEAGAMGILVYNNVSGTMNVAAASTIPFGTLTQAEGQEILAAMGKGDRVKMNLSHDFSYKSVTMVKSSSWGPTAQLSLKPEISAPGNNIVSADGTKSKADDAYTKKTGTSMATPAVAGGILLMKQHLKTIFPDATAPELTELCYDFLMSTAGHANAFVRHQGSGVMNLEKAMATKTYLTSTEDKRPKLELDDSETGEFQISFKIHNADSVSKTYDVSLTALTEGTFTMEYQGWHTTRAGINMSAELSRRWGHWLVNPTPETVTLCNGTIKDVSNWCTLEGTKAVTVKAGETVTLTMTLKANAELMDYFAENCPSGMYLEGWINLTDRDAENGVDLSIPYLGFVGDWDYPAMIDEAWWWQEPYGVNNMAQMYVSNVHGGIFLGHGDAEQGLGLNYYWDETGETYLPDRNAISPNGDGYLDALTSLEFSLLRQPRTVKLMIEYADGTVNEAYNKSYSFRRESHDSVSSSTTGLSYSGLYWDYQATELEENETALYVLEAYLDHDEFKLEDNKFARIEIPFTKDTIAPVVTAIDGGVEILDANYIAYYAVYADAQRNEMLFEDGIFAMERGVKETYKTDLSEYFVAVADYARNEAFYYVKDGVVYEMEAAGFDHGRTIVGETHMLAYSSSISNQQVEFAWYSFNDKLDQQPVRLTEIEKSSDDLETPSYKSHSDIVGMARTSDGTVYASSMSFLYTIDPVTFEKTKVAEWVTEGKKDTSVYAFQIAPGTDDIYAIVGYNGSASSGIQMCRVDLENYQLVPVWPLQLSQFRRGFDFVDADTIVMMAAYKNDTFQFMNIHDGSVESTLNLGLKDTSKYRNGLPGFYGHTSSMLYDEVENCVYLGGCMSFNRESRDDESIIWKCDLDTGVLDFMVPGYAHGKGLFALTFLEDILPADEQKCVYYRQEIAPTCDTEGYTLHTCADCGHEYRDNFVPALGHTYEGIVTEPTCTDMGYTTYTCTVCGDSYVADYTKPVDHEFVEVVIEPTCTEAGYTIYMCECGYEEIGDVVDPVGHDYEEVVIEPTCEDYGYTMYVCAVCGDSFVSGYTAPVCPAEKFTDVDTKQWYHEGICYVIRNGLMNGKSETVFAPTANLTRAELVTVLYRMAGSPSVEDLEHPFADVADDTWYTDAVIWAYNAEVVKGISNTAFAPNANITREQIAAILYRYAGAEAVEEDSLKDFADAGKVNTYAVDAMNWAVSVGLINGVAESELAPQGNATRAQIATILMRYCEG